MKFLVTGASGMLGANLCRLLTTQGHEVRALVRRAPIDHPLLDDAAIESCRGDITDSSSVIQAAQGCEGLFHLAGYISYLPRERKTCFEVNQKGTQTVLAAAAKAGIERAVITSSTAAVGVPLDDQPLNEESEFDPRFEANPYMASKRAAELAARARRDIEVVSVNPATIYGAGDVKLNTGQIFRRVLRRKMRWMPPGGLGLVSVGDCAQGHWGAWRDGRPGERYILCSHNYPLATVISEIAEILGAPRPTKTIPRGLFPLAYGAAWLNDVTWGRFGGQLSRFVVEIGFRNRYFDSAKARRELQWDPQDSLPSMLKEAADFYRLHNLLDKA